MSYDIEIRVHFSFDVQSELWSETLKHQYLQIDPFFSQSRVKKSLQNKWFDLMEAFAYIDNDIALFFSRRMKSLLRACALYFELPSYIYIYHGEGIDT